MLSIKFLLLALSLVPFTECFEHQTIVEDCIRELKQLQETAKISAETKA